MKDDDNLYRSDSDESLRQYRLNSQHAPPPRPQSTLSLNQLCSRRRSNPDIYPGARRFSTSYSHEDILSNDQLDQIHFDPRYRDYRSASSLNNGRSRSNSLNSAGSGGNLIQQYQNQYRRLSNVSPPLVGAPLVPQKRWDTNPSIFIEEYNDDDHELSNKSKTESKSESKSERNSKETLCSSNESLQPLSECDIKSLVDLSQIPFIDDDSNEAAPCRFSDDDNERKTSGIMTSGVQRNTCRKTVSFDVIAGPSSGHRHLFTNNGNNSPKNPTPNPYPTDKNHFFHGWRHRANVRPSRDGINRSPHTQSLSSVVPKPSSASRDDHCTLVDKLIRLKLEEDCKAMTQRPAGPRPPLKKDVSDESRVCEGKVKALTTYFNTLPYLTEDCRCVNVHQSTPDLSEGRNRLTHEEMEIVRRQLKEWSEFGLDRPPSEKPVCSFFDHHAPVTCCRDEKFHDCHHRNQSRKKYHQSLTNLYNPTLPRCCSQQNSRHCHVNCHKPDSDKVVLVTPMRSEKHKCRSPCFNIKDPNKKKLKVKLSTKSSVDDDNDSFVI